MGQSTEVKVEQYDSMWLEIWEQNNLNSGIFKVLRFTLTLLLYISKKILIVSYKSYLINVLYMQKDIKVIVRITLII